MDRSTAAAAAAVVQDRGWFAIDAGAGGTTQSRCGQGGLLLNALVVVVLLLHGEKLLYERLDRALRASTGYNVGEESRVERWEEFLQERQDGGFGHGAF
jgi:hypothetical protein